MADYKGQQLGNYRLLRLLGEGAFAQVYLGEHIYLGTQAAIKILNPQQTDIPTSGFIAEARNIARLIHPNIMRVLEFGIEATTPYLVLEYAPNGTLRQRHPNKTLVPLSTVVSYVKQIADALQYAHDERLIHRDVKPENILLGRRNEVLLSDFGIALMVQTMQYNLQDVAGTLLYMAPEQIQGQPLPASDQYSLGIIAYEWLTGYRPFGGSPTDIISQQLSVLPRPLREIMPTIAPSVEQVILTALDKNPNKRFASVRALALALEQASQPTPVPSLQTTNPTPTNKINATIPALDATILPHPGERAPLPSPPKTGKPDTPIPALDATILPRSIEGLSVPPPIAPRSASIARTDPPGTIVSSYRDHKNQVCSLAWAPDGSRIFSVSNDQAVHVWNPRAGNAFLTYRDISKTVRIVAVSSDGLRIATVGSDAEILVWDFTTNALVVTYRGHQENKVNALAWSPTQQILASAATDGSVHVWDTTTGQRFTIYHGHIGSVNTLAWSPNEPFPGLSYCLVSGGDDGSVQTWEASTGRNIAQYHGQSAKVSGVAWSPNSYVSPPGRTLSIATPKNSRVSSGREDGLIQMWDVTTGREAMNYRYPAPISIVAWSPDGRRFAYASNSNTIDVWDTMTNLKLISFSHTTPPLVMAWSPDSKYIASGGGNATIQVWLAP